MSDGIHAKYETRKSSNQTIADIFAGSWKTKLPSGIRSGEADFFETDFRPRWLNSQIPGGLAGKSVLELGPFEGYQTYWLEKLGADVTAVEGNNINFLKCLCLKEMFEMKAKIRHGGIIEELRTPSQKYDVVCASGVLYHMDEPIEFIERACDIADYVYIWTHYYDQEAMDRIPAEDRRKFLPQFNETRRHDRKDIPLFARSYGISDNYEEDIPLYWEGAPKDITRWMLLEDMYSVFASKNFEIAAIEFVGTGDMNGMPIASFMAKRKAQTSLMQGLRSAFTLRK